MSTALRLWTIKLLRTLGVKHFRAQSGIHQPFICHLGDSNGENPFYNFAACRTEIVLMSAWGRQFSEPLILDVGGNVGFVATQLAQLLRACQPRIFSFEPVPVTFQRLQSAVSLLKLETLVFPICSALSDAPALTRITYSEWDTMFAQITEDGANLRAGDKNTWCAVLTVDQVAAAIGQPLALIKIDVEGHEVNVLRGAAQVLSAAEPPGICLECNPVTLSERETGVEKLAEQLAGYDLYYVDDFEGQRMNFGQPIPDLKRIDWVCNIFAVPRNALAQQRWSAAVAEAASALDSFHE